MHISVCICLCLWDRAYGMEISLKAQPRFDGAETEYSCLKPFEKVSDIEESLGLMLHGSFSGGTST